MRILIWCSDTNMEFRLTNLVSQHFTLVGSVIEKKRSLKKINLKNILTGVINRSLFYVINKSWSNAQKKISKDFYGWPITKRIFVSNINSQETISFSKKLSYDVIVVSGTSLIKKELIQLKGDYGMLNLHTGLSPYIKGGPNCTNWCLANKEYHKIGNTVMYLDSGIDTGKIIRSEILDISKDWSHSELLYQTIKQGQDLYLDVLNRINNAKGKIKSVPQDSISEGITYYSKQWGIKPRIQLIKHFYFGHFKKSIQSKKYREEKSQVIVIK